MSAEAPQRGHFRRPLLCRVFGHRWYVRRSTSVRYGVLLDQRCHREFCSAERTVAAGR